MKHGIRPWEWLIAAAGAGFVVAVVGWLVYGALTQVDGPPELDAEVTGIVASGPAFVVLVRVRNSGGSTAAKAVFEATLRRDGSVIETSALEFDYVPPSSSRSGGLLFENDPRGADLTVRPVSWIEP